MDNVDLPMIDRAASEEFYESYEPKEVLGKGLSSIVRRCVHRETGEEFAVKVVDKTLDKSLESCVRQEIAILQDVSPHDWIINLREWFETSVYFFLVFELAPNGELFDQLTKAVRFSEARSRRIMIQLLCALGHLHAHRIVHRDVKPENILLDAQFNVRLSDLGFAVQLTDERPVLHDLCGTPGYMAPEALNCVAFEDAPGYGSAVDMWACGVILYTMLVGFPPFWHRKQLIMLRLIRTGKYSMEAPEWKDISETAKDLIRKLLVVQPAQRLTAEQALAHPFLGDFSANSLFEEEEEDEQEKEGEEASIDRLDFAKRVKKNSLFLYQRPARLRFAGVVKAVLASSALSNRPLLDEPMPTTRTVPDVPYNLRTVRCAIDNAAFRVYGHWVKKGDQQNRAAMFENEPKCIAMRIQSRANSVMPSPSSSPTLA